MSKTWTLAAAVLVTLAVPAGAQPVFTNVFPPAEYAARRALVFEKIGDAIAVMQGTTERPGEQPLRQSNQFFYLTGVVEPRAILLLDGCTRRATLFLNPRVERRETIMFGPSLYPGDEAAQATGIESVLPRGDFKQLLESSAKEAHKPRSAAPDDAGTRRSQPRGASLLCASSSKGRTIYAPFRPEVLGSASSSDTLALAKATRNDPWDGRPSREDAFIAKLKAAVPDSEIKDLDPILDVLRARKSPREIAIIREATRIAGLGIMKAMSDARPGLYEYELQASAEFIFKKNGAYGPAYFALVATGPNTFYTHYHKGTGKLQDGDLVQFDYAPDYKNYVSDVTRVFPANGKFTPWQREYYNIYLRLYRALMSSIQVHARPGEIIKNAVVKMDAIVASYPFTDPKIKDAAVQFVERYRKSRANSLGHTIGMEVHDVRLPTPTLEPGELFTIEPEMQIPELHLGIRLEDVILITEAGYENLSSFVPIEISGIETMMAKRDVPESDQPK